MAMNEQLTPEDKPLVPNSDEENLLRILRKNPMMGGEIQTIVKRFEQEVADGMDADEAEASLIQSLQGLGVSMMKQWAQNTQTDTLEDALAENPSLSKHSKKNSSGIPPSAR